MKIPHCFQHIVPDKTKSVLFFFKKFKTKSVGFVDYVYT